MLQHMFVCVSHCNTHACSKTRLPSHVCTGRLCLYLRTLCPVIKILCISVRTVKSEVRTNNPTKQQSVPILKSVNNGIKKN